MPVITTSKRKAGKSNSKHFFVLIIILLSIGGILFFMKDGKTASKSEIGDKKTSLENSEKLAESFKQIGESKIQVDSLDSVEVISFVQSNVGANGSTAAPKKLFNRKFAKPIEGFNGGPAEQLIGMMMSASDMYGMPPLPISSEKVALNDFMSAITNDIIVYETDSEEVVAFKEKVAEVKNQLANIIEQGGSITNALKEYENWINENKEIRDAVIDEYNRLKEEASQEEADAYLAEVNKELEAEGIETVNFGKERKRNRAQRDAREAETRKIMQEQTK